MARIGRPSDLTPEKRTRVLDAVRAGCTRFVCANLARVDVSTLYRWIAKGRRSRSGEYREFYDALREAEAEGELRLVGLLHRAASQTKDLRSAVTAATFILERRHAKRWGRRDRNTTTLKGDRGAPVVFELDTGGKPNGPPSATRGDFGDDDTGGE